MASNEAVEGSTRQRIQFDDFSKVASSTPGTLGGGPLAGKTSLLPEVVSETSHEHAYDIDDEEKARQIADEDLNKKRKQVGLVILSFPTTAAPVQKQN